LDKNRVASSVLNILFAAVGFLLIILLLTEEFRDLLKNLWRRFTVRPWMKYLAYSLAAALFLVAVGLIVFALWSLFSTKFSYD
jgi:ABC-type uncharacterized transport system permease subunit